MSYILGISSAVPEFQIRNDNLVQFYLRAFPSDEGERLKRKLNLLGRKTKINTRYSCIPDFNGNEHELYINGDYKQPVEKRMELYKEKAIPLSSKAIDAVLLQAGMKPADFTHLITVSCTGLMTPGLELLIAERYGLEHAEKSAVNFLGCYAALKALKQAHYIAQANPKACILILSVELCSLHFYPSDVNEDITANFLFADGAAGVIVCGNENKNVKDKVVLQIDDVGSALIPRTVDLMKWNLSASAFRMYLSPEVVTAIRNNILDVADKFLENRKHKMDYWAIHPGGIKIVEACQEGLGLNDEQVADSIKIMQEYGNMSSPTILFILRKILNDILSSENPPDKKIFSCAFGPGLNIEMIKFSSVNTGSSKKSHATDGFAPLLSAGD
jgi:predicted naringenin-chalcone synthase